MTITHIPSEEILLDYASGSLNEVWSLAVATHLSLCPQSRQIVSDMEAIGGKLLSEIDDISVSPDLLGKITANIDAETADNETAYNTVEFDEKTSDSYCLPEPLRSYAGGDVDDLNNFEDDITRNVFSRVGYVEVTRED